MDPFEKHLNESLHFLSFRPRSEKEVRDFLARKKTSENLVETIIERLKKQKFIDDVAFAQWWIDQRISFRKKGRRLIEQELKQKGVTQDIIDSVFQDSKNTKESEEEQMKELARKRMEKYRELPKRDLYQKLWSFLASRGFDFDAIKKVIDEVLRERV